MTSDESLVCDVEIYDDRQRTYGGRTLDQIKKLVGKNAAENYVSFYQNDKDESGWKWVGQIHQSVNTDVVLFVSSDDTVRRTFESMTVAMEQLMTLSRKNSL